MKKRVRLYDGLCEYAVNLGFTSTYFQAMRCTNIEKYNRLFSFHDNHFESILKYIAYVEGLLIDIERIMNMTNATEYNRILRANGIIKNDNWKQNFERDNRAVFQIRECDGDFIAIPYPNIKKWESIIKAYSAMGTRVV